MQPGAIEVSEFEDEADDYEEDDDEYEDEYQGPFVEASASTFESNRPQKPIHHPWRLPADAVVPGAKDDVDEGVTDRFPWLNTLHRSAARAAEEVESGFRKSLELNELGRPIFRKVKDLPGISELLIDVARPDLEKIGGGAYGDIYKLTLNAQPKAEADDGSFSAGVGRAFTDMVVKYQEVVKIPDLRRTWKELNLMTKFGSKPGFITFYGSSPDLSRTAEAILGIVDGRLNPEEAKEMVTEPFEEDEDCDGVCFYLEYADGGSLRQAVLNPNNPEEVDLKTRFGLWVDLVRAVQTMHRAGVAHRDLKPENVLIIGDCHGENPKCSAVLCDFGDACTVDGGDFPPSFDDENIGTVEYMSPEGVDAPPIDDSRMSDIWALGVMFYEIIFGRFPTAIEQTLKPLEGENGGTLSARVRQSFRVIDMLKAGGYDIRKDDRFQDIRWSFGRHAKLIKRMLELNPRKRANIDEVLTRSLAIAKEMGFTDLLEPPTLLASGGQAVVPLPQKRRFFGFGRGGGGAPDGGERVGKRKKLFAWFRQVVR